MGCLQNTETAWIYLPESKLSAGASKPWGCLENTKTVRIYSLKKLRFQRVHPDLGGV